MINLTLNEKEAKKRSCLALDVPTGGEAFQLAHDLADFVRMVKVGKQLHTVACTEESDIIRRLANMGLGIFLDLKLHDTPNTVYQASKAAAMQKGVSIFNIQ